MSADNPFLEAILDRPDDDLPRLVFADWLEERGETEQAEFVRLEAQLFRLRKYDADFPALESRLQQLWGRLDSAWTAQVGIRRVLRALVRRPYWTVRVPVEATGLPPLPAPQNQGVSLQICPLPGSDRVIFEDRCRKRIWIPEVANGASQGVRDFLLERWIDGTPLGALRVIWTGQRERRQLSYGSVYQATMNALNRALLPHLLVRITDEADALTQEAPA